MTNADASDRQGDTPRRYPPYQVCSGQVPYTPTRHTRTAAIAEVLARLGHVARSLGGRRRGMTSVVVPMWRDECGMPVVWADDDRVDVTSEGELALEWAVEVERALGPVSVADHLAWHLPAFPRVCPQPHGRMRG